MFDGKECEEIRLYGSIFFVLILKDHFLIRQNAFHLPLSPPPLKFSRKHADEYLQWVYLDLCNIFTKWDKIWGAVKNNLNAKVAVSSNALLSHSTP
jgi:hypothetical protein